MLINCKGKCSSKVHLSCLQSIYGDVVKNAAQSWQCNNCQSCRICKKGAVEGTPVVKCHVCLTCYHSACHGITVEGQIQIFKDNRFRCDACEKTRKSTTAKGKSTTDRVLRRKSVLSEKNVQVPEPVTHNDTLLSEFEDFLGFDALELVKSAVRIRPTKSAEPLVPHPNQNEQCLPNANRDPINDEIAGGDEIPDASEWSMNEVYEYFKVKFPRQAHVFAEEEIDGKTLYYLQREDIVERFQLKMGPSLRIYDHILKLQSALQQKGNGLPQLSLPIFRNL